MIVHFIYLPKERFQSYFKMILLAGIREFLPIWRKDSHLENIHFLLGNIGLLLQKVLDFQGHTKLLDNNY